MFWPLAALQLARHAFQALNLWFRRSSSILGGTRRAFQSSHDSHADCCQCTIALELACDDAFGPCPELSRARCCDDHTRKIGRQNLFDNLHQFVGLAASSLVLESCLINLCWDDYISLSESSRDCQSLLTCQIGCFVSQCQWFLA